MLFPGIEDQEPLDFKKAESLSPRSGSPVVFKWFKDGKEFEASERFQVQFDDEEDTITLVFQHVKPDDAGLYTCAASTSSGKISCSAELTVQGLINQLPRDPIAPTVKLAMADVEVSEGASAMLEAKVTAYPRPIIRWYRGKELIEVGERFKFLYEDEESYTLVIKNTRKDDQGMYRIEATNDLGSAETSAKLTVNVAPKFKKQMKDQSVMTDECLKLEVEIDGTPAPDVKWFKDGLEIKQTKGIKILHESENVYDLVIEKVKIEDSGSYKCVASNELGQQSISSVITVNGIIFNFVELVTYISYPKLVRFSSQNWKALKYSKEKRPNWQSRSSVIRSQLSSSIKTKRWSKKITKEFESSKKVMDSLNLLSKKLILRILENIKLWQITSGEKRAVKRN